MGGGVGAFVVVFHDIGEGDVLGLQIILQPLKRLVRGDVHRILHLHLKNQVGPTFQVQPQVNTGVEVLLQLLHIFGEPDDPQNARHNHNDDKYCPASNLGIHE